MDPAFELQKAVYDALIAQGVCSGSVFHRVPQKQALPYCLIGADDFQGDDTSGDDTRAEVNVAIYASSLPAAKQEFAKVRVALHSKLALPSFDIAEWHFLRVNYTTQPDGQTEQCAAAFEYLITSTFE